MAIHYRFANLVFRLDDVDIEKNPVYASFRSEEAMEYDEYIQIRPVDNIKLPTFKPVFANIQGLWVSCEGDTETRYFCDLFSGKVLEMLQYEEGTRILSVVKDEDGRMNPLSELNLLNGLALEKMMYEHGRFILHSSFIETDKGAILFTAPSGTGKSTQAELWRIRKNIEIINGDRSAIWKEGDIWYAGGIPWCGTSGIMKNRIVPIRAIVILKQGSKNEILPMNYPTKVARLLEQITINPWNRKMRIEAQSFIVELCNSVPVVCFSCLPDVNAVDFLEDYLANN